MEAKPKKYVGVLKSSAVRDVQAAKIPDADPLDDGAWYDVENAELYLGIYQGTYGDCLEKAAAFAMTDPANIVLVEVGP